jgi:hypothetical protein
VGAAVSAGAARALRADRARLAPAAVAAAVAVADLAFYHRSVNVVSPPELYTHRPDVLRHVGPADTARVYAYDYSVPPAAGATLAPVALRLARAPAGWSAGPATALAQQMALTPFTAGRWGLRGSFEVDYTGLFPVHVNQAAYFLRTLEGTPAHRRLLQIGGVTHVVALHEAPFADLRPVAVEPGLFESPIRVYAVPDPQPRTFVAAATRTGEGTAALAVLADPAFDFHREVLVPEGAPASSATARGESRIVREDATSMTVQVDAPDGGYLVILDTYDRAWRATVDGRPAEVVPANVLFRGIRMEPGRHEVELVYRPPGQRAGLAVTALSILLAGALAVRTSAGREART